MAAHTHDAVGGVRTETKAHNHIVTRDVTQDPAVTKLVDEAGRRRELRTSDSR